MKINALAGQGKTPQNTAFQGNLRGEKNNDSSTFRMPRQHLKYGEKD